MNGITKCYGNDDKKLRLSYQYPFIWQFANFISGIVSSADNVGVAKAISDNYPKSRLLDNTVASKFITSDVFTNHIENYYKVIKQINGSYKQLANVSDKEHKANSARVDNLLYEGEKSLFAVASRNFVESMTEGQNEIFAVVPDASPERVCEKIEIPAVMANPNITIINGMDKQEFKQVYDENPKIAFRVLEKTSFEQLDVRYPYPLILIKENGKSGHDYKEINLTEAKEEICKINSELVKGQSSQAVTDIANREKNSLKGVAELFAENP